MPAPPKPHIRRVRGRHTGTWFWGLYTARTSRRPIALSIRVGPLLDRIKRRPGV
jgi:hypothetical protein